MEANVLDKRLPRDAFEATLFRQFIVHALERWPEHIGVSVGSEPSAGEFALTVYPRLSRVEFAHAPHTLPTGKIWLAESPHRPDRRGIEVRWQLGDEEARTGPPSVDWSDESPGHEGQVRASQTSDPSDR